MSTRRPVAKWTVASVVVSALAVSVVAWAADTNPPVCRGTSVRLPTAKVDGVATELRSGDLGIVDVYLDTGASNLTLVHSHDPNDPPASAATFTVTQTSASSDAQGTVVVEDDQGFLCKVPVQFVVLSAGAISDQTLCSGEGVTLSVSNDNATLPGGTSVCASNLPYPDDPNDPVPGLPSNYYFSPPSDANPCRSLHIDSPISGTTFMTYGKDGAFDPLLRLMFSKFAGFSFPDFTDITTAVYYDPGTKDGEKTVCEGSEEYSSVQVACARDLRPRPATPDVPAVGPWALVLLATLMMLLVGGWLMLRRPRAEPR
jgi:hypothetical protein